MAHTLTAEINYPWGGGDPTPGASMVTIVSPTGDVEFSWSISDSFGHTQQSFEIQVALTEFIPNGIIHSTGVVNSPNTIQTIHGQDNNFLAYRGYDLSWRVRWTCTGLATSSWSPWEPILLQDEPTLTITSPAAGATITTSQPSLTWSLTNNFLPTPWSTIWNDEFRVRVYADGTNLVYDSGQAVLSVESQNPYTFTIPYPVVQDGHSYTFQVDAEIGEAYTTATTTHNAVLAEPDTAVFEVNASALETDGHVLVSWYTTTMTGFQYWAVYRKEGSSATWEIVEQITEPSVTTYKDWQVKGNTTYQYFIAQRANNQHYVQTGIEEVTTGSGGYWLIDPIDETNNLKLHNVTQDNYKNVVEKVAYLVVGRGMHVDIGEQMGREGQLTAQLRGTSLVSARQQKEALENLYLLKKPVYLRNPFGDLWYISMTDVDIQRISGVGLSEFVDVTVPYQEVGF